MKKLLSVFAILAIMITMVSCGTSKGGNPIDYGKKYLRDENQYYVFEKDQTGYYECYYETPEYTLSGRVEFVWREASDGAVYLFETETSYNEDHTKGKEISLIDKSIYFSEDFFTYSVSNHNVIHYIKEGSKLEKDLKK